MNEKALKALEYDKIIDQLTAKASSPMGKNLCKDLKPCRDLEQIQTMQTQTKDALSRLFQKGTLSFHKVKDIRGSIKRWRSAVLWELALCWKTQQRQNLMAALTVRQKPVIP